jgi:Family of unknown function (DUF6263)
LGSVPWEEPIVSYRRGLGAVLLVAGFALPVFGQDTVNLKWEFQKNKPFFQELETTTKQTMKVMGMEVTQNQTQKFVFSWNPIEQDKDKNWVIEQEIVAVKMDIEIGGNKIQYDSTKDQAGAGNPLADFFKALIGSKFKLTISPQMKVIKIEGRDEFINKLTKANPQMEGLLKQILSDEALKQMADPAFAALPDKPVKKGDAPWDKKSTLSMGPIGTFNTTYKYTYDGKDGKLDKIRVDATLDYAPPGPNASTALPFKIRDQGTKLDSKKASGTIWFDNEKHRLDHSEMSMLLEGTLSIDISGMASSVNLTQDQKTTVKTTDTNPAKTAEPAAPPTKK